MKRVNEKKMQELQEMADDYSRKKKNSINVKLLTGVAVAASTVMLLAGCSMEEAKNDDYTIKNAVNNGLLVVYEDEVAEKEINFEKEVAKYLSLQTGVNIELVDMHSVDVVKSSGNYLVVSGEMITDSKEGNKECTITFELTDSQIEKMEKALSRCVYIKGNTTGNVGRSGNIPEDIAAAKYSPDFLSGMKSVIDDPTTKISSVYDKDNKEWVFDADEPVQTSKR